MSARCAIDPAHESAHWNDGLALLVQGDLAEGFRRWRWNVAASKRFSAPEWRGEALNGATILIHAEQGFGDAIHFARYVPMVAARGGRVIFEAPVELHRRLRDDRRRRRGRRVRRSPAGFHLAVPAA